MSDSFNTGNTLPLLSPLQHTVFEFMQVQWLFKAHMDTIFFIDIIFQCYPDNLPLTHPNLGCVRWKYGNNTPP
jgi:hypothetical protein